MRIQSIVFPSDLVYPLSEWMDGRTNELMNKWKS